MVNAFSHLWDFSASQIEVLSKEITFTSTLMHRQTETSRPSPALSGEDAGNKSRVSEESLGKE